MEWITAISTVVIAIVTGVYAFLTYRQIKVTREIAQEQTRPYVVVTLPSRNRKLDLSIKNYGQRPAKGVAVSFEPDLGIVALENVGDQMFRPLLHQEFLAPGQEILGLVGLTPQIIRSKVERKFTVDVTYSDDLNNHYHERSIIDIGNYVWDKSLVRKNSEDYLGNIAVALAEIKNIMESNQKIENSP